jgi:hypothetical protein
MKVFKTGLSFKKGYIAGGISMVLIIMIVRFFLLMV